MSFVVQNEVAIDDIVDAAYLNQMIDNFEAIEDLPLSTIESTVTHAIPDATGAVGSLAITITTTGGPLLYILYGELMTTDVDTDIDARADLHIGYDGMGQDFLLGRVGIKPTLPRTPVAILRLDTGHGLAAGSHTFNLVGNKDDDIGTFTLGRAVYFAVIELPTAAEAEQTGLRSIPLLSTGSAVGADTHINQTSRNVTEYRNLQRHTMTETITTLSKDVWENSSTEIMMKVTGFYPLLCIVTAVVDELDRGREFAVDITRNNIRQSGLPEGVLQGVTAPSVGGPNYDFTITGMDVLNVPAGEHDFGVTLRDLDTGNGRVTAEITLTILEMVGNNG